MVEDKPSSEHLSESEMLTRGLELMFLKKRQVPMNRMAAFIKRFSVVALNMPTKTVMNCLQLVKRLINVCIIIMITKATEKKKYYVKKKYN